MKVKKTLATLFLILITAMFSLSAKTMTIRLVAYVPEKITFEETADSFEVNTNMDTISYDFIDGNGYSTDASSAETLVISAV